LASDHLVHFFDDGRARAQAVAAFLAEGIHQRGSALVVARPSHWAAIAGTLNDQGIATDEVVVLDARTTLTLLMTDGVIDPQRFETVATPLITELSVGSPVPVSIYGEMVDILASDGHFAAVDALEQCWNDLLTRVSARLLCGYASAHFAVGDRRRLTAVCSAHTTVRTGGEDSLGEWLVRTSS
jgi:hypothetical protein